MRKIYKVLTLVLLINIIIYTLASPFQSISFGITQITSTQIGEIDDTKYPGIKSMIKELKEKHPNWNFKILYTDLNWNDVISNEHNSHGRNLVQANSQYYDREWICSKCGTKGYDTGRWYCASEDAVKYMMDPRNSINENDIFQFMQLSYVECIYDDLKTMVAKYEYLNKKELIEEIIKIGKEKNVNPYYIVARIIQEQGNGTSVFVTGSKYKGNDGIEYEGYYNFFNINASGNSKEAVITNGLKWAKDKGWTTPEKSIEGGISTIANNYIKYGQDTMYFQKFNVSSVKYTYYTHQYMQNVLAAQSEGTILRKSLSNIGILDEKYTFVIPVYEKMPETACRAPISTYTSSRYSDETRQSSDNVNNNENTVNDTTNSNEIADNTTTSNNEIGDNTTSNNNEVIDNNVSSNEIQNNIVPSKNVKVNIETKNIMAVPGSNIDEIIGAIGGNDEMKKVEKIGTGTKIGDYTLIILGDLNGDGEIDIIDLALLKRHINKTQLLKEYYEIAGSIKSDGEEIDIIDLALLKRHINGTQSIKFEEEE